MSLQTLFLEPSGSTVNTNFVEALGEAVFSNYSQPASGSLTEVELEELVSGGVAAALVEAEAIFINDPAFTGLFTEAFAEGEDGEFKVKNKAKTEVTATFDIPANETFSFDFLAEISLTAKEIENPDAEYSKAKSKTTFVIADTTDPEHPEILDYFGVKGTLISSENVARTKSGSSGNITFSTEVDRDIDGNNDEDFLDINVLSGNYSRTFSSETRISVIEMNATTTKLLGDTYIDNLGSDVIYGSIWEDDLEGTSDADKIYGSRRKDKITGRGGNDILEGGGGRDTLKGNGGNDQIHGGDGRDIITGGRGSDILAGGEGKDTFVFREGNSFRRRELDVILDFEPGIDRVKFPNFGTFDPLSLMTDTGSGALLTLDSGGQLLFDGVSSSQLSNDDFQFV
ncbi:MAG: hypothetical protein SWJ54_19375 [Cyanobacteriota bacterium]|nr:hypothetical protein [Cyanobacteriota bacterium]